MMVTFSVRYPSVFGENIYVCGNHPLLGDNDVLRALPMQYTSDNQWYIELSMPLKEDQTLRYYYLLKDDRTGLTLAEQTLRNLALPKATQVCLCDHFQGEQPIDYPVETPFFKVAFPYTKPLLPLFSGAKPFTHQFSIRASFLAMHQTIALIGSIPALGNWDTQQAILLQRTSDKTFVAQLDLGETSDIFEYKYAVYDLIQQRFVQYEEGDNRSAAPIVHAQHYRFIDDGSFHYSTNQLWRGAGVAIPVFSLRTIDSLGVGEFLDLKLLGDWAQQANLCTIQLLPINDTTAQFNWIDSYPYAAISVFALHPLYLKVSALPYPMSADFQERLGQTSLALNAHATVDFEKALQDKWFFIQEVFDAHYDTFIHDTGFQDFFLKNSHWLTPYAAFCVLRDTYRSADFTTWGKFSSYEYAQIETFAQDNKLVQKHYFVQYHLHLQLLEVVDYLRNNHIALKGDIPIGIYRYSCDAWVSPQLYHVDVQAGAPPDDFSTQGQNWGFPTYNWQEMAKDDYTWWKMRLTTMSKYFDVIRIDHILGFFRIWQIPLHAMEGILGYFEPALAFTAQDFEDQELHWDEARFCEPYIDEVFLTQLFGDQKQEVLSRFLEKSNDRYRLRSDYDTQRKIHRYFSDNPSLSSIKHGLYDLIANVLFIRSTHQGRTVYHPRYGLDQTTSFKTLDFDTQQKVKALYLDYFYHRNESLWEAQGFEKLPAICQASQMLVCGEDLGMIPACVPKVMHWLGMLSLEVQRMPKQANTSFFHPKDAPYLSVVSPSSHDTSTLRQWWEEVPEKTQEYYQTVLLLEGNAPEECSGEMLRHIIDQHFHSPAMLAIFPLQDYLGMDETLRLDDPQKERINIPANIPHYWNYRMHLTLEELLAQILLSQTIAQQANDAGRGRINR